MGKIDEGDQNFSEDLSNDDDCSKVKLFFKKYWSNVAFFTLLAIGLAVLSLNSLGGMAIMWIGVKSGEYGF